MHVSSSIYHMQIICLLQAFEKLFLSNMASRLSRAVVRTPKGWKKLWLRLSRQLKPAQSVKHMLSIRPLTKDEKFETVFGYLQVLAVQFGFGVDMHGQDAMVRNDTLNTFMYPNPAIRRGSR